MPRRTKTVGTSERAPEVRRRCSSMSREKSLRCAWPRGADHTPRGAAERPEAHTCALSVEAAFLVAWSTVRPSLRSLWVLVVAATGCGSAETVLRSPPLEASCKKASACVVACESGDAASCHTAGTFYELGDGVAQDYGRAADLYERGCDQGSPSACNNLAVLYEIGLSVAQDNSRASQLYARGCDGGEPRACENQRRLAP